MFFGNSSIRKGKCLGRHARRGSRIRIIEAPPRKDHKAKTSKVSVCEKQKEGQESRIEKMKAVIILRIMHILSSTIFVIVSSV